MSSSAAALPHPSIEQTPGWRLFSGFFDDAAKAGFPLVPLRPRDRDPVTALSGGDYDFLMPPSAFPALVALLWRRAAQEAASFSVNRSNPHKIQVFFHLPEVPRSITLELWTRLDVRDPARHSARAIGWPALAPLVHTGEDGVSRLPPEVEIAYYLSHLATQRKRVETPLVAQRLAAYSTLARAQAPRLVPLLEGLGTAGIPAAAAAANARLRALGLLAPRTRVGVVIDFVRAKVTALPWKWRRRVRRRARIIMVTGADGVGKSTVIRRWGELLRGGLREQRFKNLFRHHPVYPVFRWARMAGTQRRAGRTVPRNAFDEIHAGVMFRLARSSWKWFRGWTVVTGRRCLDRGFPDLLFGGLRGIGVLGLRPDWESLASSMPQPDWHLHLDAADSVIRERKRELSVEALDIYREGMGRIISAAPAGAISRIGAGRTLAEVEACLRLAAGCQNVRLPWR
jgi:hypothetical protein